MPGRDKGTRRSIFPRDMRKMYRQVNGEPNGTSTALPFLPKIAKMCRKTRCRVLNEMTKNVNPISRPPFYETHRKKIASHVTKNTRRQTSSTFSARMKLDQPLEVQIGSIILKVSGKNMISNKARNTIYIQQGGPTVSYHFQHLGC